MTTLAMIWIIGLVVLILFGIIGGIIFRVFRDGSGNTIFGYIITCGLMLAFGLVLSVLDAKKFEKTEPIEITEIEYTKRAIVVYDEIGKAIEFTHIEDYNTINDSTSFYKVIQFNHFKKPIKTIYQHSNL